MIANISCLTVPKVLRLTSLLLLSSVIVVPTWTRPSVSRLGLAGISPTPPITAAVGNALSMPVYVNLYWDANWDLHNATMPKASLDGFTSAMLSSSYFGGLAEYGAGAGSFGGGFLPSASCPQKAPPMVGFYDPINPSIMGFLNCELQHGGLPQGPQVVYNLILPSGSLESDLFGNRVVCSTSPATAWHFHQTPYSPGAVAAIAALTVSGAVLSPDALLGVLAALQGGPLYTIVSADSRCGSLTNNLLHEMVETASDPYPSPNVVILSGGNGEIADLCEKFTTANPFVPPASPTFSILGAFTTTATISVPQYWSNASQRCVTGFSNTSTPTLATVTFTTGGYPTSPGSHSYTITGRGFGTLPGPTSLAAFPYLSFQNDTRHSRIGNSLNGDPQGIQITSWNDTSITVTSQLGGDSYSFWVCNPASGVCVWGSMPPAVYAVNPSGAQCPSSIPIAGTITGANFYAVRGVRLDANQNLAFTPQSNSQVTTFLPVSIGSHTITVDAFGGSSVPTGPAFVVSPQISASDCSTIDGKSCQTRPSGPASPLTDIVTVTSCGAPLGGASVSVSGQPTFTAVTNANGLAVVSHLPCYAPGSQVPKVGQTTAPVRTPVACAGTVSKPGYQAFNIALP